MKLGFEEPQSQYISGSQRARVWTERWVSDWIFCPNCGNASLSQFPANLPVADFFCTACNEQYELKSQKKPFGPKLANGSYDRKIERLSSATNPNFILLTYSASAASVTDVCFVPKHFFALDMVEKRRPLSSTARRAGWVGSNILLHKIPDSGRIHAVQNGMLIGKQEILDRWKKTLFLRQEELQARGWLIEVMNCIEHIGKLEFELDDIYAFENHLSKKYPKNTHIRPKIRQQLQILRDNGYLQFSSRGRYRLV